VDTIFNVLPVLIHQPEIRTLWVNTSAATFFRRKNNSASWFSRGTIKTFGQGPQIYGHNNMLSVTARIAWAVLMLQQQERCYCKNNMGMLLP
jgi:hypothetical protein